MTSPDTDRIQQLLANLTFIVGMAHVKAAQGEITTDEASKRTLEEVVKSVAAIEKLLVEAKKQQLVELLSEHDAICGSMFAKNPRDDCTLRQQIFDRLALLATQGENT